MGKRLRNFLAAVGIGVGSLGATGKVSAKEQPVIVQQDKRLERDYNTAARLLRREVAVYKFNKDLHFILSELEAAFENYWQLRRDAKWAGSEGYEKATLQRMKEAQVSIGSGIKKARGYGDDRLQITLNSIEAVMNTVSKLK